MSSSPRAVPSSVNAWSAEYIDAQYAQFKSDPASVAPDMRAFFLGFELGNDRAASAGDKGGGEGGSSFDRAVGSMIENYRSLGHQAARIDPFATPRERPQELTLAHYGLSDADLDRRVNGKTLRQLIDHFEHIYCGTIGAEFEHCESTAEREWFLERFERTREGAELSNDDKKRVLEFLTASETFERFLGKRYQGKKRFSLEGGETTIPLLKFLTERAGAAGTRDIIVAMAHRGRLNVLWNYLHKETEQLITEFEDSWVEGRDLSGGDVKYHRGYSGDQAMPDGTFVHLSMLNNPSHLESVNAVALGKCRAKQDSLGGGPAAQDAVLPLLIHGDGAVGGQGVVAEALNMAGVDGYTVGGTIHVVINNQVAFTTDPADGRSTGYCTDVAKMVDAPVLHVNADDPEACVWAARLAVDYRKKFRKDVFIDLVCYRKWGHNEQDEPRYTQPALYSHVDKHPGTRAVYATRLIDAGALTSADADAMVERVYAALDLSQASAKATPRNPVPPPGKGSWTGYMGTYSFDDPKTAISAQLLRDVCAALGRAPEGFSVHPKLRGLLEARAALPTTKKLSHADGEVLAFASLAAEGTSVRLSGQDCRRGTFTQRHAVLRDEKTGVRYTPMNHVYPNQRGVASIWDSPLSEYSVMGFDYGYSRGSPKTLVCWEGQFGDFANTAQVVIDQYLASSESKWDRWGGLVLLMPHGYEGQGPEHSSARLERFLQLCADDNMEVVYPSTGAQTFHMLRRQAMRNFRKPLIVMTPKKFLRVETALVDELVEGGFQHLIDDPSTPDAKGVTRVVYCSGKVYHELNDRRNVSGRKDVAIVRVEQLYPFHTELARRIDAKYPKSAERVWVQEEPRNMGAYLYIADVFREKLGIELAYIGRKAGATPATGSEKQHAKEQDKILSAAIAPGGPGKAAGDEGKSVAGRIGKAEAPEGKSARTAR
ncbi:MAG: 2-oxoglutarate dehydrogenase E1 component [Phycisphaerae bacterium]|nr:2-oxoglutarate dehydrogenase E1 component [Phycisphaerae bacterium]